MSSCEKNQTDTQAITSQSHDDQDARNQQDEARLSTLSEISEATLIATVQDSQSLSKSDDSRIMANDSMVNEKHEITVTETGEPMDQPHTPSFTAGDIIAYTARHSHSPKTPRTRISELSMDTSTISKYSSTDKDLESGIDDTAIVSWVDNNAVEAHTREQKFSSLRTHGTTRSLNSFSIPLPAEKQGEIAGLVRYTVFSVYRRLFTIVFFTNLAVFLWLVATNRKRILNVDISNLATAASANFLVAILIRQDYISNALYHVCWRVPHSVSPWIRHRLAKVYEQGGVHSGAAIAGTVWFVLLTAVITKSAVQKVLISVPIVTLSFLLLAILLLIIGFAWPWWRSSTTVIQQAGPNGTVGRTGASLHHNRFEMSHRFGGWLAIALFWVEAMLLVDHTRKANHTSFGSEMIKLPTFWFLAVITFHLVLPWIFLRKWTFDVKQCSGRAIQLTTGHTLAPLSGLAISESPLHEWHPFATFPKVDGTPGTSMIISAAGDWTKRIVANPKTQYWVKGFPKTGVLSMALIFKKVLVVTTGSGIGPCLSLMLETNKIKKTQICGILWQAHDPLNTYGDDLVGRVFDTTQDAVIIDSVLQKKKFGVQIDAEKHLIPMAYNLFKESDAEAVFVISNKKLTKQIVNSLEKRGIPAYGPIWDS